MGRNKNWNGYTSWSYLEPGFDFESYPLERQVNRVPKYDFKLSKQQEERVEEFIEKNIIISLHDHINVAPKTNPSFSPRRIFKGYEGLAYSGIDAIFDNCGRLCSNFYQVINFIGMSLCDYAHQNFIIPVLKADDITKSFKEGKVAVINTLETASSIERDIDRIDILFGLGIRSMGLTHRESNMFGSAQEESNDGGLTDFGFDAVKRMNKTGIIIDVSHTGDKTAMETIEASDKPILISHCGSRNLTDIYRMLPDEILQSCAEKDGVIGVEVAGFAPRTKKHPEGSIECLLEHIEYLIDLFGVDHVGAGPDTGYLDHTGMYRNAPLGEVGQISEPRGHYSRVRSPEVPPLINWGEMVKDLEYVKGLESPSDFANIIRGLIRDGYSDNEIAKIMGLNGLRIMKTCWPT